VVVGDDVGHYEGIAVAEYLLHLGADEVVFVTRLNALAPDMEPALTAEPAKRRLFGTGRFRLLVNSAILRIGADGLVEVGVAFQSDRVEVRAEHVVLVSHNRCNRELYDQLRDRCRDIELIGDALSPRFLEAAIWEGNLTGRRV
jgi:hypothetical protein